MNTTPALESSTTNRNTPAKAAEQAMPLLRVVGVGLVFGVVASLLAVSDRLPWQPHAAPAAQTTTASSTTIVAALGPAPRATVESPRIVTTSGEVTAKGVAAIVDTLTSDGPIADPGGALPKPRAGALFHRFVDGEMTLRVYTVQGSPDAVATAYGKELDAAGFHREKDPGGDKTDGEAKPDARGRVRRLYSKGKVEALIAVSRSPGDARESIVSIVEQPKRDER